MTKGNESAPRKPRKVTGGNIVDYILWRGDIPFEASPWGEIDGVIATMIAYANFGENELVFGSGQTLQLASLATTDLLTRLPQDGIGDAVQIRNEFLLDLANSRRFQDVVILDQVNDVDPARGIQFSAITMDVPGVGTVLAFRGTDANPVGWKEDFMMSYMTPVPAQAAALEYLKKVDAYTIGPLYLAGHSKGGNLALYSAAHTTPEIQARLRAIYSYDGPGLDDDTIASEGYRRIEPLIRSIVPHGSIVGMLMNYHPTFRVVQSNAASILQHDPFSWRLLGRRFLEEESLSDGSRIMDRTIHEWLKSCSAEQRELFVTTIFSMLDRKDRDAEQAEEDSLLKKADDEARRVIQTMISRLISIHASISWDMNVRRRLLQVSEQLRLKLKARQGELIQSDAIRIDNHGEGFADAIAEAEKMAERTGLEHKDALHLVLFAEEMLSMASIITGEMQATFWIECVNREYELHMETQTVMDRKKKKRLKAAASPKRNAVSKSFQERLSHAFEHAMASDGDEVCLDLTNADREEPGGWDGYERSILLRLADNVRITVHGSIVRMTVRKIFVL